MDASTITTQSVTLTGPGGQAVPASVTYDVADRARDHHPDGSAGASARPTRRRSRRASAPPTASPWRAPSPSASPPPRRPARASSSPTPCVPDLAGNAVQDGRGGSGPFTYEMGVKVTATTSAEIRAIRFYKSPGETGTHVGRVWTSSGTQRAQVTFTNETASGWQTQQLATPLAITAGQTYVVSVNRNAVLPAHHGRPRVPDRLGPDPHGGRRQRRLRRLARASSRPPPGNNSNYFVDLVVGGDDAPPPTTRRRSPTRRRRAGATDVTPTSPRRPRSRGPWTRRRSRRPR